MPLYIIVYTKGPKYSESTHTHSFNCLQVWWLCRVWCTVSVDTTAVRAVRRARRTVGASTVEYRSSTKVCLLSLYPLDFLAARRKTRRGTSLCGYKREREAHRRRQNTQTQTGMTTRNNSWQAEAGGGRRRQKKRPDGIVHNSISSWSTANKLRCAASTHDAHKRDRGRDLYALMTL